jgi:hypothetical protein
MNFEETKERFVDRGSHINGLADEFLIICPRCAHQARVLLNGNVEFNPANHLFKPRKLVCTHCAFTEIWQKGTVYAGGNVDWYFRQPLWLEISCCGKALWAYNHKHLEMLEDYVSAKLRERTKKGRSSFLSKLPQWIKSAKNRDEILKAIGKLKEKLP